MSVPVLFDATHDLDCFTVRFLLRALGIDYEKTPVDVFPAQDELSREHLAQSVTGALPILQVGPEVLSGVETILLFIGHTLDPLGRFVPAGNEAGTVSSWLQFASTELTVTTQARIAALTGIGPSPAQLEHARNVLVFMEDELCVRGLRGLQWFAASTCTLADIALYPHVALMRDFGLDPDEFPVLRSWMRRVRDLAPLESMPGIPDMR